ncbi:MAG: hypothetical protein JSR25_10240, partial [Proteobacteria bacterium]|nr:hypothetical protein [Pseudomonadota bacterium]
SGNPTQELPSGDLRFLSRGFIKDRRMIVETKSGGGNVLFSFLLGAVLVAVAVVGFLVWDNVRSSSANPTPGISLTIKR